jgi:hypothetical protein
VFLLDRAAEIVDGLARLAGRHTIGEADDEGVGDRLL